MLKLLFHSVSVSFYPFAAYVAIGEYGDAGQNGNINGDESWHRMENDLIILRNLLWNAICILFVWGACIFDFQFFGKPSYPSCSSLLHSANMSSQILYELSNTKRNHNGNVAVVVTKRFSLFFYVFRLRANGKDKDSMAKKRTTETIIASTKTYGN